MQKWEYDYEIIQPNWHMVTVDQKAADGEQIRATMELSEYLQRMGEGGWELVEIIQREEQHRGAWSLAFFFKRPIEE